MSRLSVRPLLAALCLSQLIPLAAAADGAWTSSFGAGPVATQLDAAGLSYLVVGAGEAEAQAAAQALATALREGGRAKLVMDGAATLGAVAALDDAAIVGRCAKLPVDRVAVVRVFPMGEGRQSSVVTVYDKAAQVTAAFSAERGTLLAAKEGGLGAIAGQGPSAGITAAAAAVVAGQSKAGKNARDEYEQRAIWFQDMVGVNQYGVQVASWSNMYEGKYRKPLDTPTFFEKVGRQDLATEYRDAEKGRTAGCLLGGTFTTVLSMGVLAWGLSGDSSESGRIVTGILGSTLIVPLVGALVTGLALPSYPTMEASEARRLADEYNRKLAAEVGYRIEE